MATNVPCNTIIVTIKIPRPPLVQGKQSSDTVPRWLEDPVRAVSWTGTDRAGRHTGGGTGTPPAGQTLQLLQFGLWLFGKQLLVIPLGVFRRRGELLLRIGIQLQQQCGALFRQRPGGPGPVPRGRQHHPASVRRRQHRYGTGRPQEWCADH